MNTAEILFGVDGYSGQGVLTPKQWVRLHREDGIGYAMWKATGEGGYFNETYFPNRDNVRLANEQLGYDGIQWGSYDWFEPSMAGRLSGVDAAHDYLNSIGPRDPGHLLMVDFESPIWDKGPLGSDIERYCVDYFMTLSTESDQLIGVYYGPYFPRETGADEWEWLGDTSKFFAWIAAPGPNQQAPDSIGWPSAGIAVPLPVVTIHQHQWHAQFAATGGTEWDRNRFHGTAVELLKYGYKGEVVPDKKRLEVPLPPPGRWSPGIAEDSDDGSGQPYIIWNAGGRTKRIDGARLIEAGLSVESYTEPGMILDVTVRNDEQLPWGQPRPKV